LLLLPDLEATRDWVWLVLGRLADDDEPEARLRETLRVFLATGNSFATTAERLTLHRNTATSSSGSDSTVGRCLFGQRCPALRADSPPR
jgi:hypothetical protein